MRGSTTQKRWTYAEYARLPSDDGSRYEIIDDQLFVTPSPSTRHQRLVARLVTRLVMFANESGTGEAFPGPLDVLLAEGDYLQPDVVFVSNERAKLLSNRGVEGAPDLAVEILSPSTASRDTGIKLERYRLHGVREYWVVDPEEETIDVWPLGDGAHEPARFGTSDTLVWRPGPDGAELSIALDGLFGD